MTVYASSVTVRNEQELADALQHGTATIITLANDIVVDRDTLRINRSVTIRGQHALSSSRDRFRVEVSHPAQVTWDGPTLHGALNVTGHVILNSGRVLGSLTLTGSHRNYGSAVMNGGMVNRVNSLWITMPTSFVMHGGTVMLPWHTGDFPSLTAVSVPDFVMYGGVITIDPQHPNTHEGRGMTGVRVDGNFTMNGGIITGFDVGVAVNYLHHDRHYIMNSGAITNNEIGILISDGFGGWIGVRETDVFITLNDGYVRGNTTDIINQRRDVETPVLPQNPNALQAVDISPATPEVGGPIIFVAEDETYIAVQSVRQALLTATQAQLQSGYVELFAENAISRAAQITVGNNIQISQATVSQSQAVAHQTQAAIETMLQQNNYQLQRALRPSVAFISDSEQISINIDPTTQNTTIEQFIILTPSFSITFSEAFVESEVRSAPLTVNITAGNSYEVVFSRPIAQPARIALPCNNNSNYMAIQRRSNGDFVGGIRNPVTGKREAFITASDTYVVVENRVDFTDIQHLSREAQNAIRHLASRGMISGVGGGRFDPNASINRAQIAQLVTRMLGIHDPNANGGFADVQRADWFFGAAGSANHHGIMHGTGNNRFSPHMILPRDQLTALSARVLRTRMGYRTPTNPNVILQRFTDRNDFANWSIDDLALATQVQLFIPRADGRFMPRDSMTRGDAALVLYRLHNKIW